MNYTLLVHRMYKLSKIRLKSGLLIGLILNLQDLFFFKKYRIAFSKNLKRKK